ncbi:DUF6522 family protein [Arenimonas composti]|uniref:PepSY domain-containing protein n=1 Tax=Arenimonas composti TR7-09 = DSM 18010 TaxID=1121013 RepID=A0A091BDW6_9GAMM|nr:DUF6522 family protein [Arenimonas composti]KFN49921.1 hypothetical protein P873_08745 [Arenimonas composti TR7-09 = DSM 18010]
MSGPLPDDRAPNPPIDIDAARVAALLDLEVGAFRALMADGKVTVLCERGTGADAGRWRATFWYGGRRARLVVDPKGRILDEG